MSSVCCPVCARTSKELIFKHFIYKCLTCGHLFRDPKYFSYDYYEKANYWYTDPNMRLLDRGKLAMVEGFFRSHTGSSCLEFGAAEGHLLQLVKSKWPHMFIYYNELVDRWDHDQKPDGTFIGPFEKVTMKDMTGLVFDNVLFFDVFEHIKKPHMLMKGLSLITIPSSRVIILTDNGDNINGENALLHYFEHMNIYTRKSISELVKPWPFVIYFYFAHKEKTILVLERV